MRYVLGCLRYNLTSLLIIPEGWSPGPASRIASGLGRLGLERERERGGVETGEW